mgnify:CR=1 FL=1
MTLKEKQEEKRRVAKIKEQRRLDQERANKFRVSTTEYGIDNSTLNANSNLVDAQTKTTKKRGKKNVGAIKSQGGSDGDFNDVDIYADGSRFEKTKDTSDNQDKLSKRVANRQINKTARKNKRAEKLAKRKGMSPEQAKDFMQNRRDRFRQKGTNFVKGLTGQAMDTAVDDRLYRRDGSGTLQNMKTEDGKTYDATAPYKGTMSKNYSDRGKARNEADEYIKSLNPKIDTPIEIPKYVAPEPEKVIQDETEKTNKKIVEENKPLEKMSDNTFAADVMPNRIVKDNVRTRAKGNFYDSAQTIDGFPGTSKATKFNIDVDKVDRKGIQDVIDEEKLKQLGLDSNFNKLPKKFNSQDILYNPNAG